MSSTASIRSRALWNVSVCVYDTKTLAYEDAYTTQAADEAKQEGRGRGGRFGQPTRTDYKTFPILTDCEDLRIP